MPLLAYKDAANVLGLPIGTLYALVARRRIPHVRLGRRLVRFDPAQLTAWIAEHRVAPDEIGAVAAVVRTHARRRARSTITSTTRKAGTK